jgi:cytochrome c-type biogenesis protein CcmF
MEFIGEHLLPGQIGHLCVVLSFVAALLSSTAYFLATRYRDQPQSEGWRNIGRFSFLLHGLSVFTVIGCLFFILTGKMYEYEYAWANISDDLPFRFVFAAFWKDQQGSFLLWSFWHIGLSLVIMMRGGKWEAPVLAVISLAEAFIACMLLGIYFGDSKVGASPFDLLREAMDAPIFKQADYLHLIKGNGLNPLLQNYWMTIHPPTLFLGFASTIVPFAFAIAGLWLQEHKEWLKPALKWSLFSGAILGTGILMGGAWAYEALSFGGYWAWDPVENTSLVPWIVMVGGIHTNLVARSTGYSIRSTYGFYLLSFILILYSTYLTRSGILGDTSAHAFTEMGLGLQLIIFISVFTVLAAWLWGKRYRSIPDVKGEEPIQSREFWMFIGSLVLLFSAILITGATSLPVYNKIVKAFNPNYVGAALQDPMAHHNRYQLWIAVFIGLLSGFGLFMRYHERNWAGWKRNFFINMAVSAAIAAVLTYLNSLWIDMKAWQMYALLFMAMFTIATNVDYMVTVAKGNLKMASSAVSHVGFGILILGIMSTGLNKSWISVNKFAMEGMIEGMRKGEDKNVMLMKEAPMPIRDGYEATYEKDTIERQTRSFAVRFKRRDKTGNYTGEEFVLYPNVMYNRQFTKVVANNPSTKHYWDHDIFTQVPALPRAELEPEAAKQAEDSLKFISYSAAIGDTIFTKGHYVVVHGLTKQPVHPDYTAEPGDIAFGLQMEAHELGNPKSYNAAPMLCLRREKGGFTLPATIGPLQMKIRLTEKSMEHMLKTDEELQYQHFGLKEGESFNFKGYTVQFTKVNRSVQNPNYQPEKDDIAVAAELDVTGPDGKKGHSSPVYLIRGNEPFSLKDEIPEMGLNFKFDKIDPKTATLSIAAALATPEQRKIPVEIAENISRSDYIVLEAIVFPGINFVWLGSILMIFGLAISLWRRWGVKD